MGKYRRSLNVTPLGARRWRLNKSFEYQVGRSYCNYIIVVPEGFTTDFASVPRIFWAFIAPWGRHTYAAVVHDYLYWVQSLPRFMADRIFLMGMRDSGVPFLQRWIMWGCVRVFGWIAWGCNARKKRKLGDKKR